MNRWGRISHQRLWLSDWSRLACLIESPDIGMPLASCLENCRRRQAITQVSTEFQEFPMNARSSPAGVGEAHVPDEIPNFRRYGRPTFATPTLPSPIDAKSLAMPGDNRLRFDKEQCRTPIIPHTGEPNPQDSVRKAEAEPVTTARTLQDQELMPECKNLCLQKGTSSETISQREK
jgi:hypothetical protein